MNTQAAFHVRVCTMRPDKTTSARRVGKYYVACLDYEAFITPYFDDALTMSEICALLLADLRGLKSRLIIILGSMVNI